MIVKSFEIKKINLDKNPFVLLYGKNDGFKSQVKTELLRNKTIALNYEEKEVIDNSNNFIESLYTKSLFEDEKLIVINRATDKIFKILSEIIDRRVENLIIIIDADNLEKKSKLRSFFEKDKSCICIPFYQDTDQALSKIASEYLRIRKFLYSSGFEFNYK